MEINSRGRYDWDIRKMWSKQYKATCDVSRGKGKSLSVEGHSISLSCAITLVKEVPTRAVVQISRRILM